MRKVFSVAMMAAMVGLVGMTRDASATVTVTLLWGACGGGGGGCAGVGSSTLTVAPAGGQTVRLDIFLTHNETSGLNGHVFSINFDTDLGNELNFTGGMPPVEWTGTDANPGPISDNYGPLTAGLNGILESDTGGPAGRINNYDSAGFTALPATGVAYSVGTFTATAPASYRVGQAFFTVNAGALTDGNDVFSGNFSVFDGTENGNGVPVTMNFQGASVNGTVIPEPGTVSLLGLGLLGLVVAGRRARRS